MRKNRKIRYLSSSPKFYAPQNGWAHKALIPWFVAGGLLVSFTASAGYPPQDLGRDVTGSISKPFVRFEPARPAAFGSFNEDPVKVFKVEPVNALIFDPDIAVIGSNGFEGVAFAYNGFMPRVFLDIPNIDGTAENAVLEDTDFEDKVLAPSFKAATSPSLLSALTARAPDGSSPSLSRAVALASTTPAPLEPEIVTMPQFSTIVQSVNLKPTVKIMPIPVSIPLVLTPKSPNYADLIDSRYVAKEQKCLAEAIYFEARSEPAQGQAAVAQVVLNRVKSGLYPTTVCGVVYQNRHRYMACQFSFACEGKSLRVTETASWRQAVDIAKAVTTGKTYLAGVGTATHYHANYVSPTWSRRLKRTDKIGTHIFYKLRPGQA